MPILTAEERVGTRIAERYLVESILGEGGMSVVFAGTHIPTDRAVAIKTLRPQHMPDPETVARFLQEARLVASLDHPNIVDILDLGTDQGTAFMVLELLRGEPLRALLDRENRLSPEQTLQTLLPVCEAVASVHEQGIVHRDLKPENIFLLRVNQDEIVPKILDFGIAKVEETTSTPADITRLRTQTGLTLGTPHYMAPEQAKGSRTAGPAVDQWALSVMLFECLAGRRPYTEERPAVMIASLLTEPVPSLGDVAKDVPEPLVTAIDRALTKRVRGRFPDVRAFAAALRTAGESAGISLPFEGSIRARRRTLTPRSLALEPPPPSKPFSLGRALRSPWSLTLPIAVAALALAVGDWLGVSSSEGARSEPRVASHASAPRASAPESTARDAGAALEGTSPAPEAPRLATPETVRAAPRKLRPAPVPRAELEPASEIDRASVSPRRARTTPDYMELHSEW